VYCTIKGTVLLFFVAIDNPNELRHVLTVKDVWFISWGHKPTAFAVRVSCFTDSDFRYLLWEYSPPYTMFAMPRRKVG